jgi:hypothetical protein
MSAAPGSFAANQHPEERTLWPYVIHDQPAWGSATSGAIASATSLAAFAPALRLIRPSLASPRLTSRDLHSDARIVTATTAGLRLAAPETMMRMTCTPNRQRGPRSSGPCCTADDLPGRACSLPRGHANHKIDFKDVLA